MKKYFSGYFESNNSNLLDILEQRVIPRSDIRLWPDEYDITRDINKDGMPFLFISLFFNDDFDRGNFRTFLGPFNGLKGEIKIADSWHDEKQENGSPSQPCQLTEPIEVIE
jgi:hypothetical protein